MSVWVLKKRHQVARLLQQWRASPNSTEEAVVWSLKKPAGRKESKNQIYGNLEGFPLRIVHCLHSSCNDSCRHPDHPVISLRNA